MRPPSVATFVCDESKGHRLLPGRAGPQPTTAVGRSVWPSPTERTATVTINSSPGSCTPPRQAPKDHSGVADPLGVSTQPATMARATDSTWARVSVPVSSLTLKLGADDLDTYTSVS